MRGRRPGKQGPATPACHLSVLPLYIVPKYIVYILERPFYDSLLIGQSLPLSAVRCSFCLYRVSGVICRVSIVLAALSLVLYRAVYAPVLHWLSFNITLLRAQLCLARKIMFMVLFWDNFQVVTQLTGLIDEAVAISATTSLEGIAGNKTLTIASPSVAFSYNKRLLQNNKLSGICDKQYFRN